MGDLGDRLESLTAPVPGSPYVAAQRQRDEQPEVHYRPDGSRYVTGVTVEGRELDESQDWRAVVVAQGLPVPDGVPVRLAKAKHNPAAWHRDGQGEDAVTRPIWVCEFTIGETATGGPSNVDELAARVAKDRKRKAPAPLGAGASVLSWNDWQLFKAVGYGIEGTVAGLYDDIDRAVDRTRELRRCGRELGRLVIAGTGDIVEGCEIYPNQQYETSGDQRDQMNAARRIIVDGIRRLAPLYEQVTVVAVGGNHGENRRNGKRVNRHDNLDAAVFEQAADVFAANPDAYGHVEFVIPRDDLSATVGVAGWVLGVTHAHTARQSGATPEQKVHNWYKDQAGAKQPVGDSHVLLSSHYHHKREASWGANDPKRLGCYWLQAPARDGGSPQHSDTYGEEAEPGMLMFAMYPERRVHDVVVL